MKTGNKQRQTAWDDFVRGVPIQLNSRNWIYGIWFVPFPGQDWLATLSKSGGRWRFHDRMRVHKHDGDDEIKSQVRELADDSDSSLQSMLGVVGQKLTKLEAIGGKPEFIKLECPGDDPKVFFELASRPWCNVERPPKEKAKEKPS